MREDHDQRRLSHVGALAAHVGSGDDEHAARIVKAQIVRHEWLAPGPFHDGVTSGVDAQRGLIHEFRPHEAELHRPPGEAGEHVDVGERRGRALQPRQGGGESVEQGIVEFALAGERAVAGAVDLVLERFQFRSDEPFGRLHRLAAQIVGRHPVGLAAAHLDEKSLDAVVAEPQIRDAGAFAFATLELDEKTLRVAAEQAHFVQFRIVAGRDHAAVAQMMRRRLGDGPREQPVLVGMRRDVAREPLQQRRHCGGGCCLRLRV